MLILRSLLSFVAKLIQAYTPFSPGSFKYREYDDISSISPLLKEVLQLVINVLVNDTFASHASVYNMKSSFRRRYIDTSKLTLYETKYVIMDNGLQVSGPPVQEKGYAWVADMSIRVLTNLRSKGHLGVSLGLCFIPYGNTRMLTDVDKNYCRVTVVGPFGVQECRSNVN